MNALTLSSVLFSSSLLLVVANALVASGRPTISKNALLTQHAGPGGGIVSNFWTRIPRGGSVRNRKQKLLHEGTPLIFTAVAATDVDENYKPNVFPKEDDENTFLGEILKANFLFDDFTTYKNAENDDMSEVIASFEKCTYDEGYLLCEQGDTEDTDYMYVIAEGSCKISIDGKKLPKPYGTMGSGSLIGDLAMLHGTPRAATVRTMTPVTLFRLHRNDFYHFLEKFSGKVKDKNTKSLAVSRKEEIQKQVKEIDHIIDQISGVKSKFQGDIIRQFQPNRRWLWTRWRGTIMQHAWKSALGNMALSIFFMVAIRFASDQSLTWPIGAIPDPEHPLIVRLKGLHKLWGYTMSITTMILSFYLNKAYGLWRDIYVKGRIIQGRLNDISMVLACAAERDPRTGRFTDRASSMLEDVAMSCRLSHAFSWAGFIKRFSVLLTPPGLSRMLSRGVMTRSQYDTLVHIRPSECAPQHVTLMWIMSRIFQGMRDGVIPDDNATKSVLMNKICDIRGTLGGLGDSLDAKIPLAYAHLVQVMVDVFLTMAPFALYSELGIWSVFAVGVLNIFYSGMNDLSKILLDPLDNCDGSFYQDSSMNMDVGVLIRESNDGSNRWKAGLQELPFEYGSK